MNDHEHIFNHRTGVTRGLVNAVYDNGLVQTADVQTHDGVTRGGVEVHHTFGLASAPPANGSKVIIIANGGDPSDMIALPAACPEARLGGLAPGEVALYGVDGTRVHIKVGGIVEVHAAASVLITAPQCSITASSGITLTGDVHMTGTLSLTGNIHVTGNIDATGTITP